MGKFKKGQSGNPNGRPKGSKNKNTQTMQTIYSRALQENECKFRKELAKLEGYQFCQIYLKMTEYVAPKVSKVEQTLDFSRMSDAEVDELFEKALQHYEFD